MNVPLRSRDFTRTTFGHRKRRIVRSLAEAMYTHSSGPTKEGLDKLVDEVDAFISPASAPLRFALGILLELIQWLPLFILGRFSVFENLSLHDRGEMLDRLETSRFTVLPLIVVAWKTVMTILLFEHPEELSDMGYPGPQRERYKRGLPVATSSASPL